MSIMDNMNSLLTSNGSYLDKKAEKWATWAKYAAAIGLLAILAPVLITAFGGLIAAIGIVVVGSTVSALERPFTQRLKALRMSLLVSQAKKHPIPTLHAILADGRKAAVEGGEALEAFAGDISAHKLNMQTLARKYPKEAAPFLDSVRVQEEAFERKRVAHADYVKNLDAFEAEVQKASMLWDAAQANNRFTARSKGLGLQFEDRLQTETALASVGEMLVRSEAAMRFNLLSQDAGFEKLTIGHVPMMDDVNNDVDKLTVFHSKKGA